MIKKLLPFICLLLSAFVAKASHNRAGEISYENLGGYNYRITVTTYANTQNTTVDRCSVEVIIYGLDTLTAYRVNGDSTLCPAPANDGEFIGNNTKKNIYQCTYTFPGPYTYKIFVEDPNRNAGILNMTNSGSVVFYIESTITINSLLGNGNNSPVLTNMPVDFACTGSCFYHNPGAFDPDGDSLSYHLEPSLQGPGIPVPNYTFPNTNGGGSIALDPYTGEFSWCSPGAWAQGEWNIAIRIKEWRKVGSQYWEVGSVLRDIQITVLPCANTPPVIASVNDTCIEAGTSLSFTVTATDGNVNPVQNITLTATGGPFIVSPAATFTAASPSNPATGTFNWQPGCAQIRTQPYTVTFKAADSGSPVNLIDFETMMVTVVGPAPVNVTATPAGTSMIVNWAAPPCSPVIQYKIYRKDNCSTWSHGNCETGVPAYTGYTLIGSTSGSTLTFTDNNGGQGLIQGVDYSYRVVAVYTGAVDGYASSQACGRLVRDVPVITHVDVISTGATNGVIEVKWENPVADSANFDTTQFPGPYKIVLQRATGFAGSFSPVDSITSATFAGLNTLSHKDSLLNTGSTPYTYRIDFHAGAVYIGSTQAASSVYLSLTPADNQLTLSWQEVVPWTNYMYHIYKETSPNVFTLLDSTTSTSYTDAGLINGRTYCYKIKAYGQYSDTTITTPLINHSEIMCGQPQDMTAPCAPSLTILADCNISQNYLVWTNPNNFCSDDVVGYNIYYTPVKGGSYSLLSTIAAASDTDYVFAGMETIAGCFVITAIDTFNNESVYSNEFCVDNCPVYELPNVFTPDKDGTNDLFIPFPYKYVQDIDIKIYDRWGLLMFETTDPDINWDGTSQSTGRACPAGVYYYTCTVNEVRLDGIQPRVLKGFVHIFYNQSGQVK